MPPWGGTVQCPKLVPNGGGTDTMNNANDLGAGCSAMSWTTRDGRHLWGRNFDFNRMAGESGVLFKILLLHIVLPAALTLLISEFMRKKGWIKFGDMKLDL